MGPNRGVPHFFVGDCVAMFDDSPWTIIDCQWVGEERLCWEEYDVVSCESRRGTWMMPIAVATF